MRLVKLSAFQYINVDAITDIHIGEDRTIIRFVAPDFNEAYAKLPTQPHRIELTGAAEQHFRRWIEAHSEDATQPSHQARSLDQPPGEE